MPFGMGPVGWAYMPSYAYHYFGVSYTGWPWWYGWGRGGGRGRRLGWRWFMPYGYTWW
jgi:hypothetical protein